MDVLVVSKFGALIIKLLEHLCEGSCVGLSFQLFYIIWKNTTASLYAKIGFNFVRTKTKQKNSQTILQHWLHPFFLLPLTTKTFYCSMPHEPLDLLCKPSGVCSGYIFFCDYLVLMCNSLILLMLNIFSHICHVCFFHGRVSIQICFLPFNRVFHFLSVQYEKILHIVTNTRWWDETLLIFSPRLWLLFSFCVCFHFLT